jgi:hypothetical protein
MNSVGCARGCDFWLCEYCFDDITNWSFKEDENCKLYQEGVSRYLQ